MFKYIKCLGGLMAHQGTRRVYDALREKEEKSISEFNNNILRLL